jgi:hypothetical protein
MYALALVSLVISLSIAAVITACALAIAVLASLTFAIRLAYKRGAHVGRTEARELCLREQDAPVQLFMSCLTTLVTSACEEGQETIRAQRILRFISAFESTISAVSNPIGDELARLQSILNASEQEALDSTHRGELRRTLTMLNEKWPERRVEIERKLRDVIAPSAPEPHR